VNARGLLELLRVRHDTAKGWTFFAELRDGTGWDRRTIDAFAFGTWQSQKYRAIAYEIKVSRGDFAREIADPTKRAPWETVAGECYFVTPPSLVERDEVPEGWGLLESRGDKLVRRKLAAQRTVDPWPWSFVAMIARRATEGPSPLPPAVWRYCGADIDAERLQEVCTSLAGDEVRRLQAQLERTKLQLKYATERREADLAMVRALQAAGCHRAEDVAALVEGKVSPTKLQECRRHALAAKRQIERLITTLDGGRATPIG